MITKYNTYNENVTHYPFYKVYFKVNSKEESDKIYDYLEKLLDMKIVYRPNIVGYPNYISIPTDLNRISKYHDNEVDYAFTYYDDNPSEESIREFIDEDKGIDPVILNINNLKLINDILLKGKKTNFINYNEPRKLVYESMGKYNYQNISVKVNSMKDVQKVYTYLDGLVDFEIDHKNRERFNINSFPNYIIVSTTLERLKKKGTNKFTSNPSYYNDSIYKEWLLRYPEMDPNIIKINELSILKSILIDGKRTKIINYNEPRKLVYEKKSSRLFRF